MIITLYIFSQQTDTTRKKTVFPIVIRALFAIRKVGLHWNKKQRTIVSVSWQDIAI